MIAFSLPPETQRRPLRVRTQVSDKMTFEDHRSFNDCENKIASGERSFWQVGRALGLIRDKRLYREGFSSFEDYVASRWDMSVKNAHRLIKAAKIMRNLAESLQIGDTDPMPANEAQVRQLARLSGRDQIKVWRGLTQEAGQTGARITAQVIRERVNHLFASRRKPSADACATPAGTRQPTQMIGFRCKAEVSLDDFLGRIRQVIVAWSHLRQIDAAELAPGSAGCFHGPPKRFEPHPGVAFSRGGFSFPSVTYGPRAGSRGPGGLLSPPFLP